MKFSKWLWPLLLVAWSFQTLRATTPASTKVKFVEKTWEEATSVAKQQGRLFMVFFGASYSGICQNMDRSTFMNENLSWFISQNVVPLRLDVQSFDGLRWSQKYEITNMPTTLIFNSQGRLVRRVEGYVSGANLLNTLKAFATTGNTKASPSAPIVTSWKPKPVNTPVIKSKEVTPVTKPAVQTKANSGSSSATTQKPTITKTNYQIVTKANHLKGYGLQVGSFDSYTPAVRCAAGLNGKTGTNKVMVFSGSLNGKPKYRVIIGNSVDKADIEKLKKQLAAVSKDSMIKSLSELQ